MRRSGFVDPSSQITKIERIGKIYRLRYMKIVIVGSGLGNLAIHVSRTGLVRWWISNRRNAVGGKRRMSHRLVHRDYVFLCMALSIVAPHSCHAAVQVVMRIMARMDV